MPRGQRAHPDAVHVGVDGLLRDFGRRLKYRERPFVTLISRRRGQLSQLSEGCRSNFNKLTQLVAEVVGKEVHVTIISLKKAM